MSARPSGSMLWFKVVRVLPWPMRVPSPMVMPPVTHVARTLTKLGARDRIHLVILAHTHGLA